jgi:geranylgeranyl diphosphate synthase type II
MLTTNEILDKVNQALVHLSFDREPAGLYAPVRYVLSLGGKRIRPVLMLMAYSLYKKDIDACMPAALGLEIYHNFTLLHDDLMDKADTRRGKPCVHKKWDDNTAILSGDSMLVLAFQMMQECPAEALPQVMSLFTETALEIDEGQQMDMDFEKRLDVTEEEYIEMIRLKTSVLLACAMALGALQAGAKDADVECLHSFGEKIGLAFQLQDDLLDVYGDFATFGKRIGGDILENKKTFLLISALQAASPEQRTELERWIKTNPSSQKEQQEKIAAVTALYDAIGVKGMTTNRINEFFHQARMLLEHLKLPLETKQPLWEYAMSLMERKS